MDLNGKVAFKKHKTRGFQSLWLDENLFERWLAPYHQENKAICTNFKPNFKIRIIFSFYEKIMIYFLF